MTALVLRSPRARLSFRLRTRVALVCLGLAALVVLAVAGDVAYGDVNVPLGDVLATLAGGGDRGTRFVVLDLRLPRAANAALAGAALGISGAIFQTFARNALASPDIIGVTGGAALFGVAAYVLGGSPQLAPVAAFAGAMTVAVLMYVLAWRKGLSPLRLVLVGVGLNAMAQAGIAFTLIRGRLEDVAQAYTWLVGSVNLRNWDDFRPLVVCFLVLAPAAAVLARSLDALALGDESARALGVPVERTRLALVIVAAGLAAVGVAAAGPIGFVAFVSPMIARRLTGLPGSAVIPVAALAGAALVPGADLAGRALLGDNEMPVGIVTALLGAPVFLTLLYRANRPREAA